MLDENPPVRGKKRVGISPMIFLKGDWYVQTAVGVDTSGGRGAVGEGGKVKSWIAFERSKGDDVL